MAIPANSPLVIDYETVEILADGSTIASTEAYRDNFRVLSLAAAYRSTDKIVSVYIHGESDCREWLRNNAAGRLLIAHNVQFEKLVSICRFPDINLDFSIDTMRLAQVYDNGGDDCSVEYIYDDDGLVDNEGAPVVKRKPTQGLGLVACLKRILGRSGSHKEEAHRWIRENVKDTADKPVKKGKEGAYLNHLPKDILERYNIADAVLTLELYEYLVARFGILEFDWSLDHKLFLSTVGHLVSAKIRGVSVDRDTLATNAALVKQEIHQIGTRFAEEFSAYIEELVADRTRAYISKPKTEKGRVKRAKKVEEKNPKAIEEIRFNPGSNKQLTELFMGKLGIEPKFFTAKGAPSFKSSLLGQWGLGGELLKKRRKRMIVLAQMEALLRMSEQDGKWHMDLRACGARTGRMAGGRG